MNIQVEKKDIECIGHTSYNNNGNLAVICSVDTSSIENILLRNILKCFGEEYKIIADYDTDSEEIGNSDIVYETNKKGSRATSPWLRRRAFSATIHSLKCFMSGWVMTNHCADSSSLLTSGCGEVIEP